MCQVLRKIERLYTQEKTWLPTNGVMMATNVLKRTCFCSDVIPDTLSSTSTEKFRIPKHLEACKSEFFNKLFLNTLLRVAMLR